MSHISMRHVTHANESCHTHQWFMSHVNESCHTYQWIMSHMWMSHVTHINEWCHTCEWVMVHRARPFFSVTLLKNEIFVNDMWGDRLGQGLYILIAKLFCGTYRWVMSHVTETYMYPWPMHMCDMTHAHVRHDSCTCETWLMHMWDMTHAYVYIYIYSSSTCVAWPMHMRDMTHAYVWHDSCICRAYPTHSPAMRPPCKAFLRSSAYVWTLPVKSK